VVFSGAAPFDFKGAVFLFTGNKRSASRPDFYFVPLLASLYMAPYHRSTVFPVVGESASLEKRASNSFEGRAFTI
jgi:hypothetical protein